MKILHTIAGIWEHTGGPAESVPMLCLELAKRGNNVRLATLEGPLSKTVKRCGREGVDLLTFPKLPGQFSIALSRALPDLCKTSDIIHGHGLWLQPNWATAKNAASTKKPLVISTRGSLGPKSLRHSYWKKKVAAALFDNRSLRYASCIHATSIMEYESVRAFGLRNPVAIIPNGVELPTTGIRGDFFEKFPALRGKRILLFLSRLSWEKGLPLLAEAWEGLKREFIDWHLVIAGQGEPGYEKEIKNLFASKGLCESVIWTGLLKGEEKWSALAAADLFVLPSHSENFGIAIAEALAIGVPVITTHGTPWSELVDKDCGWWVPVEANAIEKALREAMSLPGEKRKVMGENGKALIKEKYVWRQVAEQMESVYRWILAGGIPPVCLKIDW
ncbi:MAG: glycosyltransferase [Candidatus Berkelbacteria bacterium]|nr:glycosyltransferase [Candidatus Berkelbacteria bacterium]